MKSIRFIFWDQLSFNLPSIRDIKKNDIVLMCELREYFFSILHHKKKIAFILASMRSFACELSKKGINVRYVKLEDSYLNLNDEIERAVKELGADSVIFTKASEYDYYLKLVSISKNIGVDVEIREDDRFLCSISEFSDWANGRKELRMEYFYRQMRKKYSILVDDKNIPEGGKWNYDEENRNPASGEIRSPKRISHKKSEILSKVLELVEREFSKNFGNLNPFFYAINSEEANIELDHFIETLLPHFGEYQDIMIEGEAYLYHSLISSYLNIGLLSPIEVCRKAETAYKEGKAPLNSVEGFIRQILGWREYIRGIYWHFMPNYRDMNFLEARQKLPMFYWNGKTNMNCIKEAVSHTIEHAYSHHIQRLMITGNFALLAGFDVAEVQEWYLSVYSDAFEWVEMPNTLGMALFGDGGIVASKPYAASGKYINRMSNFCKNCKYDPEILIGENACPFNSLYWNFISKNENKLKNIQRLAYVFSTYNKFSESKKNDIKSQAELYLEKISKSEI
jgi:deoxyribodipyrimidine photolyase-related protein